MTSTVIGPQQSTAHRPPAPRPAILSVVPPVGLAVAAVPVLLWGRSYPGFPTSAAAIVFFFSLVAIVLAVRLRPRGLPTVATLVAVLAVLAGGLVATHAVGDRLLLARWSDSVADFETQVASLPAPGTPSGQAFDAGYHHYPSVCPSMIGSITISECKRLDDGYLFLQAPDALTDSSGILYLPLADGPQATVRDTTDLTPLGGPWWSWTCHC